MEQEISTAGNYNISQLKMMELIKMNGDIWISSLQLAAISGRDHKNVMRDIRRDIIEGLVQLKKDLDVFDKKIVYEEHERYLLKLDEKDWAKIDEKLQTNPEFITQVFETKRTENNHSLIENDERFFIIDSINKIKLKSTTYTDTTGRKINMFILNDRAATLCLMRYSIAVRVVIMDKFINMYRELHSAQK